jgi:hypothetical protein
MEHIFSRIRIVFSNMNMESDREKYYKWNSNASISHPYWNRIRIRISILTVLTNTNTDNSDLQTSISSPYMLRGGRHVSTRFVRRQVPSVRTALL